MQGLFKLALVGSEAQLRDFLDAAKKNPKLSGWYFDEVPQSTGGLRSIDSHGLQRFQDKYKYVIENGGSGNIDDVNRMVMAVKVMAPELEAVLLTQTLDYENDYTWSISYSPTDCVCFTTDGIAYLSKGEEGQPLSLAEMEDLGYGVDEIAADGVMGYYKREYDSDEMSDEEKINLQEVEEFLEEARGGNFEWNSKVYDLVRDYIENRVKEMPYRLFDWEDGIPTLEYLTSLFAGCWGLDLRIEDTPTTILYERKPEGAPEKPEVQELTNGKVKLTFRRKK